MSSTFRNKSAGPPSWFQVQPNPRAAFRLFCFPYAGGGSSIYRGWSTQLHGVDVVPALLPGREARVREPALTRSEQLVENLAREIFQYLDRPFGFFGHSMGAILSFELARRLRSERGVEPDYLFISGRRAPQLPEKDPYIHDLPEPQFIAEIEKMNGTPREVLEHAELMQMLIPLLRADFAVCHTYSYVPGAPLRCPITVIGGTQDDTTTPAKLEAWREQTTARCRLHMLDGGHFFIHDQLAQVFPLIMNGLRG